MSEIYRYPIVTQGMEEYMKRPGAAPRGPIRTDIPDAQALAIVKDYIAAHWSKVGRKGHGALTHDYVVPGGWYGSLWDWDSFFISCAMPDAGLPLAQGSILNLVEHVQEDGRPPKQGTTEGTYLYSSHPKPLHAQFAYIVAKRMGDFSWVEPVWRNLLAINAWEEKNTVNRGYFAWLTYEGYGIDNNPAVYGRPLFTSAGIDLAVWHYREYRAMEKLSRALNHSDGAEFAAKAEALKLRIQKDYWDPVDRFFYNIDLSVLDPTWRQKMTWRYHLKLRNWASLFPLWGGVADPGQARRLADVVMDVNEFLSPAGVRSHSAVDPIYNNEPMGGPSNWQGPVWGLSTFVTAYGLARSGFRQEALEVAWRLIRTFAADIRTNGCMHEFYHGDTGQPAMKPEFLCWNLLAGRVIDDLQGGTDSTALDLLD